MRCGATATAPFTDICVWCALPQGHAGRHRGFIPQTACPDATFEWPGERPTPPPPSPKSPPMTDRDTLTALLAGTPGIGDCAAHQGAGRVIRSGWRPPAQVITEPNELPIGSIVLRDGNAWQRGKQCWWMAGTRAKWDKPHGSGPITLLHLPTENGDTE